MNETLKLTVEYIHDRTKTPKWLRKVCDKRCDAIATVETITQRGGGWWHKITLRDGRELSVENIVEFKALQF